jgi:cephalosporin-C deacetylase-like acetyl esterase
MDERRTDAPHSLIPSMTPSRRRARLAPAALLSLLASGGAAAQAPAGASAGAPALAAALFAYDPARPLALRDSLVGSDDGVAVHAISFDSPRGGRATGFLFVPPAPAGARLAGIVYGHGTGQGARSQGPKAVYLARHGAVVVVVDAPYVRRGGAPLRFMPADSTELAQLVVDQRRAVDLLVARPDVDASRVAYVGHSYGGMVGALLSSVEPRLRTFVLSAPDAGLVAHMRSDAALPPEYAALAGPERARWVAALAPFDVPPLVGRAAGAPILFQHGRQDDTVTPASAAHVHAAVTTPHEVRWYDAGHRLPSPAYVDQLAWLSRWVGTAPPTPADTAGPAFPAPAPGPAR